MTDTTIPRVLAAINSVQRAVSEVGIAKARKNTDQNFLYRGIDDVYNVVGPILANAGLLILPQGLQRTERTYTTSTGKTGVHATVQGHYRWQHVEGGYVDVEAFGEAQDFQARAHQKAMSTAYKNMLFSVLCIPLDGADADDDQTGAPVAEPTAWQQLCAFIIENGLELDKVAKFAKVETVHDIADERIPGLIAALRRRLQPEGTSVHADVVASEKNLTPDSAAQDRAHEIARALAEHGQPKALELWVKTEREDSQLADVVWMKLASNVRTAIRKAGIRSSMEVTKPALSAAYQNAYSLITAAVDEDEVNHALDLIIEGNTLTPAELADITVYAQSREFPAA